MAAATVAPGTDRQLDTSAGSEFARWALARLTPQITKEVSTSWPHACSVSDDVAAWVKFFLGHQAKPRATKRATNAGIPQRVQQGLLTLLSVYPTTAIPKVVLERVTRTI